MVDMIAQFKRRKCPLHKEQPRPCQLCFAKAESQRDAQWRQESIRLHKLYLEARS